MKDIKMTYTKDEFFMAFAPNFNFEYNPDQLVEICLEHNLIKKNKDNTYTIRERSTKERKKR